MTPRLTEIEKMSGAASLEDKIGSSIWDMLRCLLNTLDIISI